MVPLKKPKRAEIAGLPRQSSNGRGAIKAGGYGGKMSTKPPKWATKEYKPVFRMPSEQNAEFKESDSVFPKGLGAPQFSTLSQSQQKPLHAHSISPRSEVPPNIMNMNNSFHATPDLHVS